MPMRQNVLDAKPMSVPLNDNKHSEAPLIAFTLCTPAAAGIAALRSEEHTSELQSPDHLS